MSEPLVIPKDLKRDYELATRIVDYHYVQSLVRPMKLEEEIRFISAKREILRDERIARLEAENAVLKAQVERLSAPCDCCREKAGTDDYCQDGCNCKDALIAARSKP